MSNILIYEPHKEQVRRLIFLLRLAGHDCTVAYTADEAVNWLRADKFLETGFDLLLLGADPEQAILDLLSEEAQGRREIPLVCLRRYESKHGEVLPTGITYCQPENLISTLSDFLPDSEALEKQKSP